MWTKSVNQTKTGFPVLQALLAWLRKALCFSFLFTQPLRKKTSASYVSSKHGYLIFRFRGVFFFLSLSSNPFHFPFLKLVGVCCSWGVCRKCWTMLAADIRCWPFWPFFARRRLHEDASIIVRDGWCHVLLCLNASASASQRQLSFLLPFPFN